MGQNIDINGSLKGTDSNPHWRSSRSNCRYGGNYKRTNWSLKMWLNCCNFMIKSIGEEMLLMDEQRKWFWGRYTPSEDCWNDNKRFRNYISLVDKTVARFERTDCNLEIRSTVCKMLSNCISFYRKLSVKGNSSWCGKLQQTNLLSYFKKLPQPPQPSVTTTLFSQQPSIPRPAKWLQFMKAQMMASIFNNKVY